MRLSKKAANQMGLTPEARKEEKERKRKETEEKALAKLETRLEKDKVRRAVRDRKKAAERCALASDLALSEALDGLDVSERMDSKGRRGHLADTLAAAEREHERLVRTLEEARRTLEEARKALEAAGHNLETFDNWNVDGPDGSTERAQTAWAKHEEAWAAPEISAAWRKKNRDRQTRKRARGRGFGVAGEDR